MNLKESLKSGKSQLYKQAWLTAYDYPLARHLDESGVDLILVGDSLGNVVLGYPDTIDVTMEDMLHHLKAARRGVTRAPLAVDLPNHSCDTPEQALLNSKKMIEAGADAVKLEGALIDQIKLLTLNKLEVIGHLGMLPQHVREEGGYHKKGKSADEAELLIKNAIALQEAGCCAIVLELVDAVVAERISNQLDIPTIGIGSGAGCNGQILVTTDLLGLQPWFRPAFVKPKADLSASIQKAIKDYISEIRS